MPPSHDQESIFDFERLAAAVTLAKEERGMQLKEIALESGLDPAKLTNLTRHHAKLSLDNVFMICDWLRQNVDSFRRPNPPIWVVERRQKAAIISDEEHRTRRAVQDRAMATAQRSEQWISDGSMDELMAAARRATYTERAQANA
jgi:hypothetical protein